MHRRNPFALLVEVYYSTDIWKLVNVASKLSKKRRQDWVFFCKKTVNCEGILLIFVLWKLEAIYMI